MLRTKTKPRVVICPHTHVEVMAPWPLTREEALAEKCARYYPMTPCPTHYNIPEGKKPTVFVKTGIYGCCAQINAAADYRAAIQRGEPTDVGQAHVRGLNYYWTYSEHRECGHSGKRTLSGQCFECSNAVSAPSPRQAAIAAGKSWYMPLPGDECKEGHLAERRVSNGSCRQCEQGSRVEDKALPMNKDPQFADLIIDWDTARGLGLKMYRTGVPCRAGHTGWRYVSTRGCLECMGR